MAQLRVSTTELTSGCTLDRQPVAFHDAHGADRATAGRAATCGGWP